MTPDPDPDPEYPPERKIYFYDGGKDNIVYYITYPLLDEDENEKVNKSIEEFIGSVKVTD
jgi:hypothetical protein